MAIRPRLLALLFATVWLLTFVQIAAADGLGGAVSGVAHVAAPVATSVSRAVASVPVVGSPSASKPTTAPPAQATPATKPVTNAVAPVSAAAKPLIANPLPAVAQPVAHVEAAIVQPVAQVTKPVTQAAAPVIDAAGQVVAKPIGQTVAQVQPLTGPAVQTLAPVVAPVTHAAQAVVQPVTAAAAPVVSPVVQAVEPIARPVTDTIQPVSAPVAHAAQPLVEPVAAVAAPLVSPVAQIVEPPAAEVKPVTEPLAPILTPVLQRPVLTPDQPSGPAPQAPPAPLAPSTPQAPSTPVDEPRTPPALAVDDTSAPMIVTGTLPRRQAADPTPTQADPSVRHLVDSSQLAVAAKPAAAVAQPAEPASADGPSVLLSDGMPGPQSVEIVGLVELVMDGQSIQPAVEASESQRPFAARTVGNAEKDPFELSPFASMLSTSIMSRGSGWPVQSTLSAPRLPGDPMGSDGRTPFEQPIASAASAAASASTSLGRGGSGFATAWLIGLAILLLARWSLLTSVKLRPPPSMLLSNAAPPG